MHEHYQLAEHVSYTEVDNEAVLLNLHTGAYYGLNHVGAALIEALKNGASTSSTASEIALEYAVEQQQVREDLAALLKEMLEQGLVTSV